MSLLGLEDQLIVAIRRITRSIDLHSRELMQAVGLTAPQLATLQAIARLQPVPAGTLACSIHVSQATLTGILARLESREFVTRSRSGADRRSVRVELTEAGKAALQSAPSLLQHSFRDKFMQLCEWEQTQMLATLQRMASMMEAEATETSTAVDPAVLAGANGAADPSLDSHVVCSQPLEEPGQVEVPQEGL